MAETMGTKHFWSQDQSSGLESHELAPEIADKSMRGSLRRGVISENVKFSSTLFHENEEKAIQGPLQL